MKALFLIFHGFDPSNGISKKIHYQIKGLKNSGIDTKCCYYNIDRNGVRSWMIDDSALTILGNNIWAKIKKRINYKPIAQYIKDNQIDFVYMRSDHNANPFTISLVNHIKSCGAKIIMEIPTYPYDQEYVTRRMKMELAVDRLFRHRMAKLLNGIVTFSNAKKIFGSKTIRISNGIDFEAIPLKQKVNDITNELHLIGVAEIHFWHGFDRLIKGLAQYYKTEKEYKVYFHVIGPFYNEKDKELFNQLITDNGLQQYVIFHGRMQGEELDEMFDKCDFAIGSLGRHRSGITNIKTLKNREYAARGIPFIYSETDDDFEDKEYILKAPADETSIDIEKVIGFCRNIKMRPEDIRRTVQSLSWTVQMQKVLENIFPNLILPIRQQE
jgi:glycosyltransferase involved in cell wall biosynthesis